VPLGSSGHGRMVHLSGVSRLHFADLATVQGTTTLFRILDSTREVITAKYFPSIQAARSAAPRRSERWPVTGRAATPPHGPGQHPQPVGPAISLPILVPATKHVLPRSAQGRLWPRPKSISGLEPYRPHVCALSLLKGRLGAKTLTHQSTIKMGVT